MFPGTAATWMPFHFHENMANDLWDSLIVYSPYMEHLLNGFFAVVRASRNRDPADNDNLIVSRINYATKRISQLFANVGGFNNHTSQNFLIFILLEQ